MMKLLLRAFGLILSGLFLLLLATVLFNYFCEEYHPLTSDKDFLRVAFKEFPYEPSGSWYHKMGKIKFIDEIPFFKKISSIKKDEWDSFAKELTKIEAQLDAAIKIKMQSAEGVLVRKLDKQLDEKREMLKKEINKDTEIKKLNAKIDEIDKKIYSFRVAYVTLLKKIELLSKKQDYILKGVPGSFRRYLWPFSILVYMFLIDPLNAQREIKKQVAEFLGQMKKLASKTKPKVDEIIILRKKREEKIADIVKKSKKLQALTADIKSLETEYSNARDIYRVLDSKQAQRYSNLVERSRRLRNKLHKIFDEMTNVESRN